MKKSADSNASTPPPAPLPQSSPAIHLNRVPAQTHISVSLEVTRCTYTHIHTRARFGQGTHLHQGNYWGQNQCQLLRLSFFKCLWLSAHKENTKKKI